MTTFAQMIAKPDIRRVLLCEMRPRKEIETLVWTATGAGSYWCDWPYFPVYAVTDTVTAFTKKTSIALCDGAASSYFHDAANARLYVHTTDGDSPTHQTSGEYDFLYFATVMIPISSGAGKTATELIAKPVAYIPTGMTDTMLYLPFLDASGVSVTQEVESFETGSLTLSYGSLSILNDGSAYYWERDYIWDYADFVIKVGPTGEVYAQFGTIFVGKLLNPRINDRALSFAVVSPLVELNEDIVTLKYLTSNYANLDPTAEGKPEPWMFGIVSGIVPTCIETLTHIYRITCSALEELTGVSKDGVALTLGVDYTVAADNSEFTLLADPGDAKITCQVKGAKVNQAKNLIKYSESYGNPVWDGLTYVYGLFFKPDMTLYVADPYGSNHATEFASYDPSPPPYDVNLDYISGVYQSFANSGTTYSVGTTYTVSIWARCVSGTLGVNFGFDEVQCTAFTLTTAWQRLTYTAAYVNNGVTKNIYIAEHTDDNVAWQIAFAQAVQASALTRYTKTTATIKTVDEYSYLTADILAFFLSGSGPVSKAFTIDIEGINELLIRREGIFIGWQIADVQKGIDFLGVLMRTGAFQLTPMLDGSIKPFIYKTTVDDDALRIDGPDMQSFEKYRETTSTRKAIIVKYFYQQYLDKWKSIVSSDADVEDRYGAKDYLEIETAHIVGGFADMVGDFLLEIYKQPPTKVDLKVGAIAMDLVPGDQIVLNKTVIRPLGG